jgi:hypothetical protein
MFATPDALASLCAPWASFYSHSKTAETVVTFLHVAPIVVGGGLAIALDRTTLRIDEDEAARARHLHEVSLAHRSVVAALAISLLSGLAMMAADLDTFLGSWIFWVKMALIVALLVNGALMTRSERRLRNGVSDQWGTLRVLAFTSLFLWLVITLAGVALVNAA